MRYARGYESTSLHPTLNRRGQTQPGASRIALLRCLRLTTLPNSAGIRSWRTSAGDRPATGLPQTDGADRHPRLQCPWTGGPARRLLPPPSTAHHLLRGRAGAFRKTCCIAVRATQAVSGEPGRWSWWPRSASSRGSPPHRCPTKACGAPSNDSKPTGSVPHWITSVRRVGAWKSSASYGRGRVKTV